MGKPTGMGLYKFSDVNVPAALLTVVHGINDRGQIVGGYDGRHRSRIRFWKTIAS